MKADPLGSAFIVCAGRLWVSFAPVIAGGVVGFERSPGQGKVNDNYDGDMELPPPDPKKLLAAWNEWESGTETPGRVMANLKTAGMAELLEQLAAAAIEADSA